MKKNLLSLLLLSAGVYAMAETKEVKLYSTDFQNWDAKASSASVSTKTVTTKAGDITFRWAETEIKPDGTNTKFTNTEVITTGYAMAAKTPTPYIETSVIPSVTTVSYVHAATGGSRGWGLMVKTDGAAQWDTIQTAYCVQAGSKVDVAVNRENVILRWYNLNGSQNAYMTEFAINGNVEVAPRTFKDFELNFMNTTTLPEIPEGVTSLTGTPRGDSHGLDKDFKMVLTVDGPVKFTFGGCQYANNPSVVTVKKGETVIGEVDVKTPGCYHNGGTATWTYNVEEAAELTIIGAEYNSYIKAEACDYVADVTVTYFDQNGKLLGKTVVSPDEPLKFAYTDKDLTYTEDQAFRGWAKTDGVKFVEGTAPGQDLKLYALVTPIEAANVGTHYSYDLTKPSFYAEDHECFISVGSGKFHDGQHGWEFAAGDKIELPVAGKAYVQMGLCRYSAEGEISVTNKTKGESVATFEGLVSACTTHTFFYDGEADTLVITFPAQNYISAVNVYNVTAQIEKTESGYYEIPSGDASSLLLVLLQLQKGDKVFLHDGLYDLGELVLTTISVDSVSVIGESMAGTVIRNAPDASLESINGTATLVLSGKGTYLQDLTLQNALDYYKANNGRAVALWDKGTGTICKNVQLLSYQDTYYSNKPGQKLYWEDGSIHGTVDYICGSGTVYFKGVELFNEKRNSSGGGSDCITASNAQASQGDKGYVFESCTIKSACPTVSLSRAWNDQPQVVYLNTVFDYSAGKFSLSASGIQRWTIQGMNNVDPYLFGEYNSVDVDGNVVSPASNVVKFVSKNNPEMETILTAEQAAAFSYANVLGSWDPAAECVQAAVAGGSLNGSTVEWSATEGCEAYLLEVNGESHIVTATSATVEGEITSASVRAANGRGGFGEAHVILAPVSVSAIETNVSCQTRCFNLNGQPVAAGSKGLMLVNGTKVYVK
ncbi:MAG: hypothetical protein KBT20_11175 [Bacteroidales bacterium]|nr:hypothetical protein [Candidatus Liminaster caballi]